MANITGDVVLVNINNNPAFFARIEDIKPDVKKGWWQITLLVLQYPLNTIVWILREGYINGDEFTMGGTPMRIDSIDSIKNQESDIDYESEFEIFDIPEDTFESADTTTPAKKPSKATVISLTDHLKKK